MNFFPRPANMLRWILPILVVSCVVGCATMASQAPLVRISKVPDGQTCKLALAVSNRYSADVEGNYMDIALTDRTGRILQRQQGYFQHLFQSGYTTSISFPVRAGCDDIAGLKVYSLGFMRPGGGLFPGGERYELELVGF